MFIPDILPVCSHSIPKSVCKVRWQSKQGLSSYRAYSAKNHNFSAKVAQMSVPLPYSQITSNHYETRQHSVSHRGIYVWIFSSLKDHFLASYWQTTDFLNFGKKTVDMINLHSTIRISINFLNFSLRLGAFESCRGGLSRGVFVFYIAVVVV